MSLKNVDPTTLKSWLDNREAILIDVREPAEYSAQHIAGAVLLPLSNVSKHTLPAHIGKKLVIHCQKGGRGGTACEKLLLEDPNLDIYNLLGGMNSWADAQLPIQSSGKSFLPLDRQVQLAIGLLLLSASLLGYLLSPAFFLLTGMMGIGLTIAGATGFCGLARIIAKMPWNQMQSKSCCAIK